MLHIRIFVKRGIIMSVLKIIFCILLCCPLAYISFLLFSGLMDTVLKKK